jgi:hypothetical protein
VIEGTLGSVLGRAEFAAGAWLGLIGLVTGVVLAWGWRRAGRAGPLPAAGLLLAAAFGAGLLLAPALPRFGGWQLAPLGLAVPLGGWLVADFDARWGRQGYGPVLFAISLAGVYVTVPDTEQALVALGAALPLAFLGWPWPLASLGRLGAYAATATLVVVVAAGGVGRASAMVGGVACLGIFLVEPVAAGLGPRRQGVLERVPAGRWGTPVVATVHLGLVLVAARVAGLQPSAGRAALVVAAELGLAVTLALATTRRSQAG